MLRRTVRELLEPCQQPQRRWSQLLEVAGGDVLGRLGVAVDVALGLVAEATFEFVGVAAGGRGEREGERVAQVVGAERADVPVRVGVFGVVPAADLLADRG